MSIIILSWYILMSVWCAYVALRVSMIYALFKAQFICRSDEKVLAIVSAGSER